MLFLDLLGKTSPTGTPLSVGHVCLLLCRQAYEYLRGSSKWLMRAQNLRSQLTAPDSLLYPVEAYDSERAL